VGEPTTGDGYLFGQFDRSQQMLSKPRAPMLDDVPCRAECRLLDDIVHLSGRNPKFGRPVLIESKTCRAMQSSQTSSPRPSLQDPIEPDLPWAADPHKAKMQGIVVDAIRFLAKPGRQKRSISRRAAALLEVWNTNFDLGNVFDGVWGSAQRRGSGRPRLLSARDRNRCGFGAGIVCPPRSKSQRGEPCARIFACMCGPHGRTQGLHL
jgi:hypothetical protein